MANFQFMSIEVLVLQEVEYVISFAKKYDKSHDFFFEGVLFERNIDLIVTYV